MDEFTINSMHLENRWISISCHFKSVSNFNLSKCRMKIKNQNLKFTVEKMVNCSVLLNPGLIRSIADIDLLCIIIRAIPACLCVWKCSVYAQHVVQHQLYIARVIRYIFMITCLVQSSWLDSTSETVLFSSYKHIKVFIITHAYDLKDDVKHADWHRHKLAAYIGHFCCFFSKAWAFKSLHSFWMLI